MSFISQLDWRFATKKFDSFKKVSSDDLNQILKAIRLAPSSRGLQPFHVYIVSDSELRQRLYSISQNQAQVVEASQLLIFCVRLDATERVELYLKRNAEINLIDKENNDILREKILGTIKSKSPTELLAWASRQTYIALGFALAACCELRIDSCPMEGFDKEKVDLALGLPAHLKSLCYLALGYRGQEPVRAKVRFTEQDIFTYI